MRRVGIAALSLKMVICWSLLSSKAETGGRSLKSSLLERICPLLVLEKERFSGFPAHTETKQDSFHCSRICIGESCGVGYWAPGAENSDYFIQCGGPGPCWLFDTQVEND